MKQGGAFGSLDDLDNRAGAADKRMYGRLRLERAVYTHEQLLLCGEEQSPTCDM